MQNTKFCAILLVLVIIAGIFSISPAISSLINSVTIRWTGKISVTNVTARSGSARDIQAAVDQVVAAGGIGNVHIPEGTFNFVEVREPWTTVNIPAGVNLFGAPTERGHNDQVVEWRTVLVMPYDVPGNDDVGVPEWFRIIGNSDPNKPSRFSDVKLVGYRDINPNSKSMHVGVSVESVIDFRIDHCFFKHTCGGGVWAWGEYCRGVIDHCKFINDYGIPEPYEQRTIDYGVGVYRTFGTTKWEDDIYKVVGQYTDYTVFIEDCYFSKWRHCVCSNDGSHYVFRHSIIENDFGYGSIDAHGTYNNVGTRAVEVYDNTFKDATSYEWITFIRGGGGTFFNNKVPSAGTYEYFVYLVDEGNVQKCWPRNIYVWNNTLPTGMPPVIVYGRAKENVDYFLYAMPNYQPYPYPHPLTLKTTP